LKPERNWNSSQGPGVRQGALPEFPDHEDVNLERNQQLSDVLFSPIG
jgi:hypothetical protein